MRDPVYATRRPTHPGEPLTITREGEARRWHARDANGELVAKDQYRNDLVPGLRRDGFDPTLIDKDACA